MLYRFAALLGYNVVFGCCWNWLCPQTEQSQIRTGIAAEQSGQIFNNNSQVTSPEEDNSPRDKPYVRPILDLESVIPQPAQDTVSLKIEQAPDQASAKAGIQEQDRDKLMVVGQPILDLKSVLSGYFINSKAPAVPIKLTEACYPVEGNPALLKNQILAVWQNLKPRKSINLLELFSKQKGDALIVLDHRYVLVKLKSQSNDLELHPLPKLNYLYDYSVLGFKSNKKKPLCIVMPDGFEGEIVDEEQNSACFEAQELNLGSVPKYDGRNNPGWINVEEFALKYSTEKVLSLDGANCCVCMFDVNVRKIFRIRLRAKRINVKGLMIEVKEEKKPKSPIYQLAHKSTIYNGALVHCMITNIDYDPNSHKLKCALVLLGGDLDGPLFAENAKNIGDKGASLSNIIF